MASGKRRAKRRTNERRGSSTGQGLLRAVMTQMAGLLVLGGGRRRRTRMPLLRLAVSMAVVAAGLSLPALTTALSRVPEANPDTLVPTAQISTTSTQTTIPAGSYIIDMGQSTQTIANGLKPYGLVYELMIKDMVPVDWVINDAKAVDGTDFTYNSKAYKGGPFIITAPYAQQALASIQAWQKNGVVVDGPTTSTITVPVRQALTNWPNALLDGTNGVIAQAYYTEAGIPQTIVNGATGKTKTAYQFMSPTDPSFLNDCYDLYAMPHADPTYATHHPLKQFNAQGGFIWAGCHAVSVMENIRDPQGNLDLNFLTSNGLINYQNHQGITLPLVRSTVGGDPVNQFLGTTANAQTNGSEQIYLPSKGSAWNPDTRLIETDPTQADVLAGNSPGPAVADIYGRGFGNAANGMVMYQSGHSLDGTAKGSAPPGPDNVAAIRAFLNFNLLAGIERGLSVTTNVPSTIVQNTTVPVSATISGGSANYTYQWVSSCGGTFDVPSGSITRSGTSVTVTANFTAPANAQGCSLKLSVVDSCGRTSFGSSNTTIVEQADLAVTKTDGRTVLQAGQSDTYTITVTNNGPGTANPATLTDAWPATYLTYGSATASQGTCTFDGTTVSCALGSLAPGATATVKLTGTAKADADGTIANTAKVSAPQGDPNPGNNTATDTTVVAPNGLHLTKTANPSSIDLSTASSAPVTFTFTVTDTGPNPLTNVAVTDTDLPSCSPAYASGDSNGDKVLQTTETWLYSCTVAVSGGLHNHATATAVDPQIGPLSANADATVDAIAPGISIDKGVDGQVATAGGQVVFTITVKNTGDTALSNVTTSDASTPACNRYLGTMAVGATISYNCSLNPAPTAGTSAVNTIKVTGTSPSGSSVTGSDDAPYSTVARDLSITKKPVDCSTGAALTNPAYYPGDQVCYQIVAKNNSATTTESNIVLTDNLPTGVGNPTTTWSTSSANKSTTVMSDNFDANGADATSVTTWRNGWVDVNEGTDKTKGTTVLANTGTTDVSGYGNGSAGSSGCNTTQAASGAGCVVFIKQTTGIAYPVSLTSASPGATSCTLQFDWRVVQSDNKGLSIHVGYATGTGSNYTTGWTDISTITAASGAVSNTTTGSWTTATITIPAAGISNGIAFGARTYFADGSTANGNDRWEMNNASITCTQPYSPSGSTTNTPGIIAASAGVNLLPGQTLTATVKATMTSAGGTFPRELVNVAAISSDQQTTPSQAAATVQRVIPAIDLVKTADQSLIEPGQKVTYTFTVTNTGNDPLGAVSISDTQVPGCTPTLKGGDANGDGRLDLTETWVYTCSVALSDSLVNTATAKGTATTASSAPGGPGNGGALPTVNDTGTATVNVVHSGIKIVKKADQTTVRPGTPVTYTYTVTLATGDTEPLTGVYVTDDKCASVQGPTYAGGNSDTTLESGETWTYTCTQALSATTTNTATAYGVDRLGTTDAATDKATVTVITPAIAIDKTADPTTIAPGQTVTFTMKVTNTGNDPLTAVTLSDSQCSPVTYVSGDNGDNTLQPGEAWTYRCAKAISVDTTNTASVTGTDSLGGVVSASDSANVDVQSPSVQLVKQVDQALVQPGTSVTYTIIAINNGDLALTAVTVTDNTCSPLTGPTSGSTTGPAASGTLAVGAKWFYTCTKTITTATTNTANVTATAQGPNGPQNVTAQASAYVRTYDPTLKVTKTPDQTKVAPGTPVTYTYRVTNTSQCANDDDLCLDDNAVTAVSVTDDKCANVVARADDAGVNTGDTGRPDGAGVGDGILDVGETWVYTCTTPVDDPTTNTATVTATDVLGKTVGPVTTTAFVDTSVDPTMTVVKSGPATATVGETVTYTFKVTNTTDCSGAPDPTWCRSASYVAALVITDDVTGTPAYQSGDANTDSRLDVGETWVYTSTYTVTASDVPNGVTNHVTVTGTDRDGDPVGPAKDSHHLDVIAQTTVYLLKTAPDGTHLTGSAWQLQGDDSGAPGPVLSSPSVAAVPGGAGEFAIADLNPGTYWLTETTAPSGYELLAQPIGFAVAADHTVTIQHPTTAVTVTRTADDAPEIVVTDDPAISLPFLGGTGTRWIMLAGAGLLILAAVFGVGARSRRRPGRRGRS